MRRSVGSPVGAGFPTTCLASVSLTGSQHTLLVTGYVGPLDTGAFDESTAFYYAIADYIYDARADLACFPLVLVTFTNIPFIYARPASTSEPAGLLMSCDPDRLP